MSEPAIFAFSVHCQLSENHGRKKKKKSKLEFATVL
jgi:hypothetical protein